NLIYVMIVCLDDIGHSISFQYAQLGDNVTLKCFYPDIISHVSWYKQTAGQKPQPISTIYRYNVEATFHNDFKDNHRFTVPGGKGVFHLRISNIQPSDSAMYYCGALRGNFIEFSVGIFLILKGNKQLLFNIEKYLLRTTLNVSFLNVSFLSVSFLNVSFLSVSIVVSYSSGFPTIIISLFHCLRVLLLNMAAS
uniref:Ig-like domain-containing protein n=1 Tax=Esox lucius TaxID=8010 RepID=A0A3P8YZA1_ESOLU